MDLSNLKEQVSNMTMYDLKAGVRKVQNAVMNYTEMESKVREATNNEPWGASSSLMQEIANGTHSYQLLNEIMPMIYRRFTDKSAEEWRQIYKGLQLLEFLVKNGSERVVDDARSHMSLLRMLRQFHFIDQNGKDQGINVRNRSSELVKLLGDVELIRSERKKARANRNKFRGFEGGSGIGSGIGGGGGGMTGSGGRYSGFGSDSIGYGGYSGGVFGDGGGFGGSSSDFQDTGRRGNRFDEYDEYDEADATPPPRRGSSPPRARREAKQPPAPKEPEVDLFDFGDDEVTTTTPSTAAGKQPASGGNGLDILDSKPMDDDDFDDFQSATPAPAPAPASSNQFGMPASTVSTTSSTQFAAPKPVSGTQESNLNGLVGFQSMTPTPPSSSIASPALSQTSSAINPQQQQQKTQPLKPTGFQAATPNYFTSVSTNSPQGPAGGVSGHRPNMPSTSSFTSATTTTSSGAGAANKPAPAKSSGDAFGSLWSTASASAGIQKSSSVNKGPNLASMAKEKASAGIWGATPSNAASPSPRAQTGSSQPKTTGSSGMDDLLG